MVISKNTKVKQKIIDALKDKAELSTDRGVFIKSHFTKPNKKVRKHSGRYTPQIEDKSMKFDEIKMQALEPEGEYDDWMERRDGMRGNSDETKLRKGKGSYWQDKEDIKKVNEKIKKQLTIKKAMREKK